MLFDSDFDRAEKFIHSVLPDAFLFNDARQTVLVYLVRLGGPSWFIEEFNGMLQSIESYDFRVAAERLNDTSFARRNPEMAKLLSEMLRTGKMTK